MARRYDVEEVTVRFKDGTSTTVSVEKGFFEETTNGYKVGSNHRAKRPDWREVFIGVTVA